ncbi:MAG: DNA mismatch repair endonuclease MutL, partial [Gemmatimonadota bacterium]
TTEAGDAVGTAVRVEGGRILSVDQFPRRPGTTVEVRNLFFNAPARRKFLRSAGAETRAVSEALTALALANPAVDFELASGDRTLLALRPVDDLATRVAELWGEEAASSLIPTSGEEGGLVLKGLVQRPDAAGPGFRRGYLFVNGRPFRNPALLRAAERGYRTTLSQGQRPWLFLYLQIRDGAVDVNVHPAKAEVKFQDSRRVEALVEESVRLALAGSESSATLDTQLGPRGMKVQEGGGSAPTYRGGSARARGEAAAESQMALFLAGTGESGEEDDGLGVPTGMAAAGGPRLWQLHDTYILAETREGLLIIDQHSAHERVLFQRLMEAFGGEGQESQRLLFPLTLRLSAAETRQVLDLKGILSKAGFEVEEFGGDTVILQSVPNPHPYFDAGRCFREMIQELTEGSELVRSAKNQHERIAMTFACKGAIKAGQRLGQEEMTELFDALFATDLPYHDVHGRPTIVRLSSAELERKFGRH